MIEIFYASIAFSIFVLLWNSRPLLENNYFLWMAIAFLFVGVIDLIHMLASKGMGIFQKYDANLTTQLWIAGRISKTSLFSWLLCLSDEGSIFRLHCSAIVEQSVYYFFPFSS
jgi:hypothetical protein